MIGHAVALTKALNAEIEELRTINAEMLAALHLVDCYLDGRVDVNWEGTGPNAAMCLQTEVRAAIAKAEGK